MRLNWESPLGSRGNNGPTYIASFNSVYPDNWNCHQNLGLLEEMGQARKDGAQR